MAQAESTKYTPDEALLLAVKTVGRTHPDPKVLAVITEIEGEVEERKQRAAGRSRKAKRARAAGRHVETPDPGVAAG